MKVSHLSGVQHLRMDKTDEKKSNNPVTHFLRKLFGIKNSHAEKKPQEQIFEPRINNYHRLTRGEAAYLGEQLSKEFNKESARNLKQNVTAPVWHLSPYANVNLGRSSEV